MTQPQMLICKEIRISNMYVYYTPVTSKLVFVVVIV